jgi:hypothetical protein
MDDDDTGRQDDAEPETTTTMTTMIEGSRLLDLDRKRVFLCFFNG